MNLKLHQLLTAYVCDTALVEVTGKGAEKYLRDHDIVDSDVERISEKPIKRRIKENGLKALLVDFHRTGMEKVMNYMEKGEVIAPVTDLFEQYKSQIEELL
jgi:hypothetical protein